MENEVHKDLISEEEAKQIRRESAQAIEDSVRGFDKESLRKAFKRGNPRLARLYEAEANYNGEAPVVSPPPVQYICTLEVARLPFYRKYKQRVKGEVYLTPNNKEVVRNIIRWMLGDEQSIYDINKGLFIYGDYGRGKTDLLYTMKQFSFLGNQHFDNVIKLPAIQSYKFMMQKAKENKSIKGLYKKEGISVIDDLGFMQDTQLKIYGQTTEVLDEIIDHRHRVWKGNHNSISIFTSNLTPEFIEEHHGRGISGRLVEMCNVIFWDGEDFRLK